MDQYLISVRGSKDHKFQRVTQDMDNGSLGLGSCAQDALERYAGVVRPDWYDGLWIYDTYEYRLEKTDGSLEASIVETAFFAVTSGALGIPRYERINR